MLDDVKDQGELTIYLKSYLLAWSRHIRSHIREKRIIPTWIARAGFPLLKRLWQKRSFRSSFTANRASLLNGKVPKRIKIPTQSPFLAWAPGAEIGNPRPEGLLPSS